MNRTRKAMLSACVLVAFAAFACAPSNGTALADPAPAAPPAEEGPPLSDEPSDPHADPLPPGVLRRIGTARLRHGGPAYALAFSPDGKVIASGGADHTVYLWDAATGKALHRLVGHADDVHAVAFSPDGKLLATAGGSLPPREDGNDTDIRLWDPATGKEVRRLRGHPWTISGLAFSPDGKRLASSSNDGSVRLWTVAGSAEPLQIPRQGHAVLAVAFAPGGGLLATAGSDGTVRLRDAASGREVGRLDGHNDFVSGVAFSPDGKLLAAVTLKNAVRMWDVAERREVRRFEADGKFASAWSAGVAFSPDGKTLAGSGDSGKVRLWDVATGEERAGLPTSDDGTNALAFSPDGKMLAAAGGLGAIDRWEWPSGKAMPCGGLYQGTITALTFSPDGRTLAAGGTARTVRLWDAATGRQRRLIAEGTKSHDALAFSPDGAHLAGWNMSGIDVWKVGVGKGDRPFNPAFAQAAELAFLADGTLLYTGLFRVWHEALPRYHELPRMDKVEGVSPGRIAVTPDGKSVVSDGGVDVPRWDVASGKLAETFGPQEGRGMTAVRFAPNGKVLAAVYGRRILLLWDVAAQKVLVRLAGDGLRFETLAFAPDGKLLATASDFDPVVRVWDTSTGREVRRLTGHRGGVTALAFAPDGKVLATGGKDATILLWDVEAVLRTAGGAE